MLQSTLIGPMFGLAGPMDQMALQMTAPPQQLAMAMSPFSPTEMGFPSADLTNELNRAMEMGGMQPYDHTWVPNYGGGMAIPKTNFDPMFDEAAAKTGLPMWWLKGTAAAESDFRMLKPNHAGATGVMQLLPGTFAELQRRYPQHGLTSINDPRSNILAGALYLKEQYDKFKSYDLASAAYNAGPGNVTKYHGIPPFKETRAYVPRVMRYREEQ